MLNKNPDDISLPVDKSGGGEKPNKKIVIAAIAAAVIAIAAVAIHQGLLG